MTVTVFLVDRRHRVERLRAAAVERGGPHGDGHALLVLGAAAEHAARAAADERLGPQRLVHALERRLGLLHVRRRRRTARRGRRGAPSSAAPAVWAASIAPTRGSSCVEMPVPMRTPMRLTILRARAAWADPAGRAILGRVTPR